jgi:hypothetical protein
LNTLWSYESCYESPEGILDVGSLLKVEADSEFELECDDYRELAFPRVFSEGGLGESSYETPG